jgi:hypothetical protein
MPRPTLEEQRHALNRRIEQALHDKHKPQQRTVSSVLAGYLQGFDLDVQARPTGDLLADLDADLDLDDVLDGAP